MEPRRAPSGSRRSTEAFFPHPSSSFSGIPPRPPANRMWSYGPPEKFPWVRAENDSAPSGGGQACQQASYSIRFFFFLEFVLSFFPSCPDTIHSIILNCPIGKISEAANFSSLGQKVGFATDQDHPPPRGRGCTRLLFKFGDPGGEWVCGFGQTPPFGSDRRPEKNFDSFF